MNALNQRLVHLVIALASVLPVMVQAEPLVSQATVALEGTHDSDARQQALRSLHLRMQYLLSGEVFDGSVSDDARSRVVALNNQHYLLLLPRPLAESSVQKHFLNEVSISFHLGKEGQVSDPTLYNEFASPNDSQHTIYVEKSAIADGSDITEAKPIVDYDNRPALSVRLTGPAGERMSKVTGDNVGEQMAILFTRNGNTRVLVFATIRATFGRDFMTTGVTAEEAEQASKFMRFGVSNAKFKYVNNLNLK